MTKTQKPSKTAAARTTTVHINPPTDYKLLAEKYVLVRYILPESLRLQLDKTKLYPLLHNQLKSQIDAPYRSYLHDEIDGSKRWAIYALFPRIGNQSQKLPQIRFENDNLPVREIGFHQLQLHILVKLLQVNYFRHSDPAKTSRFVGQDKCYVYVRSDSKDYKYHTCLEIEMKGDLRNENIFYVYGQARNFIRRDDINLQYIGFNIYYAWSEIRHGLTMFRQLKREEVESYKKNIYQQWGKPSNRASLEFHNTDKIEHSRGYIVNAFIKGFNTYLSELGFIVEHVEREFYKYEDSSVEKFKLPFDKLGPVYVYDARFSKHHPLQSYLDAYKSVKFQIIDSIPTDCTQPVLIFQDGAKKAYGEGQPLNGYEDPHKRLYTEFPYVTKQFVNINPNDPESDECRDASAYLEYDFEAPSAPEQAMTLNHLFLKDLILHHRESTERLPLVPTPMIFVHKESHGRGKNKTSQEVALYFDGDIPKFLNLGNLEHKKHLEELAQNLEVDWYECEEAMLEYHKKLNSDNGFSSYDIVIGQGFFAHIEDARETLLYEYDEMLRRNAEANKEYPIDDLKLTDHYDKINGKPQYRKELLDLGGYFLEKGKVVTPKNKELTKALEQYKALRAYDELLDEIEPRYRVLSINQLKDDEALMERVLDVFKYFEYKDSRGLIGLYNKIGMFKGLRDSEVVPIYTGIWYTDDLRFIVGDTQGMNSTQARANRVRQFKLYHGEDVFDINPLLDSMSVTFVRHNQYTVLPYYFNLIDIYIDTVLDHEQPTADNAPIE